MSAAVPAHPGTDSTPLPRLLQASLRLGIIESAAVLVIGLVSRFLDGTPETALLAILVTAATVAVTFLPGQWVGARTFNGIATAAAIGLGATMVFLVVDVTFFQPLGLYTHRWREIGGGSNWWYHPIWWMVGTLLPWLGAWTLSNQAAKGAMPSLLSAAVPCLIFTAVCGAGAVVMHFPGAGWNVGTFGVAFLPGLAVGTMVSALGARRKQ